MPADRQSRGELTTSTVRQMTATHASQVGEEDIASCRLLSRSFHYNVMCCHIKILELVNLRRHKYSTEARLIAVITITLKVGGDKCQQRRRKTGLGFEK